MGATVATEEVDVALGASYRLVELIGRGATGEVWRGVDRRTDETIAAKLLRPEHLEDDVLIDRFLRERSILTGLRDENVVAVRDLVVEGNRLAIVMDYVDGGSLRDVLRTDGPLPPGVALGVSAAVLDGLAAAHDGRVLHRDVKPDNVLLSSRWRELGPGGVKLSDFGISQILADLATTTTGLIGTPEYMAPEQLVTGAGDLPADVYGAGVMLYELLAGRTPFAGAGTGYTVAHRHVTSMPPRIPVPDRVWDLLADLLDKDPTRRPTARTAAARLKAVREEVPDLPALPPQESPDQFASAGGPATEVRGLTPPAADPETGVAGETGHAEVQPLPELGTAGQATMLRSMPSIPVAAPTTPTKIDPPSLWSRVSWRDPRTIAVLVAGALLIGGSVFLLARSGVDPSADAPPTATSTVRAQQQSPAKPTGLGISRSASWDARARVAELTTTYSAERSALAGPFLEVVPGENGANAADGCPAVQWQGATVKLNRSSVTGIESPCGWSVEPARLAARGSVTVLARVPLVLKGTDPGAELQTWLESVATATETATSDAQVTSTAYPAQRLTDIQVVAPARTVSGKTLNISLVPVWPSGPDDLNPLFRSPPTGEASAMLTAAAGGKAGVRFGDGCAGALLLSSDGLVVTARSVAQTCQVNAKVGNFIDLASNTFSIATRGN